MILLMTVLVFSIETKEFFVDSTLQRHYTALAEIKNIYNVINRNPVSRERMEEAIERLAVLEKDDFILRYDAKLFRAKAYERLGDISNGIVILKEVANNATDNLSKADAVIRLAEVYESQSRFDEAIAILERESRLFSSYRKNEYNFFIARLMHKTQNLESAKKYLLNVGEVDRPYREIFEEIVEYNWDGYSQQEKKRLLLSFAGMKMYNSYARFGGKYLKEYSPSPREAEEIALVLIENTRNGSANELIAVLKENSAYEKVYKEIEDIQNLTRNEISGGSATGRGIYYHRRLYHHRRLDTYNHISARTLYLNYLDGDIEPVYANRNIILAARNFLAFKRYDTLTNIIESTYEKLGIKNTGQTLSQYASFWNGYSHYMLENYDRAVEELENAIAIKPDGYFAINAHELIVKAVEKKNISFDEYLNGLEYRYISARDDLAKLHYAKVLYKFRKGYARDMIRDRVVELTKKIYGQHSLYDFDGETIKQLRVSKEYIKFVAYARFGFVEKAGAVLTSVGINDPRAKEILILRELVKSGQFSLSNPILSKMHRDDFFDNNFAFLSKELKQIYYPMPYRAEISAALTGLRNPRVDEHLVLSIIREESMYMPHARSRVGAAGLMQLMPATGRMMAKRILKTSDVDFYNTTTNVILGTAYLNDCVRGYGLYEGIGSYNSGNVIMRRTKRRFNPANDLELVEIIPYRETRNYVRKIFSNYYRYKDIYEREPMIVELPIGRI
jgi:hypothetical protein